MYKQQQQIISNNNQDNSLDLIHLLSVMSKPHSGWQLNAAQHELFLNALADAFVQKKKLFEQIKKLIQLYGENVRGLYEGLETIIRPFLTAFKCHLLGKILQIKQKLTEEEEKYLKKQKINMKQLFSTTVENYKRKLYEQLCLASAEEDRSVNQLRSLIAAQITLVSQFGDYLLSSSKTIDLTYVDCNDVDFSGLDVRYVVFPKNSLDKANLTNIQCNAEQFLEVRGLQSVKIDSILFKEIEKIKIEKITASFEICAKELGDIQKTLETVKLLDCLICHGEKPTFNHLSEQQLAALANMALHSTSLNALPPVYSWSIVKLSEVSDPFKGFKRPKLIEVIEDMLFSRKCQLSSEVIAHFQYQKISLLFEQMKTDIVEELQLHNEELPEEAKNNNNKMIEQYVKFAKELKKNKRAILKEYEQKMIDQLIVHLSSDPDKLLGFTTEYRLQMALDFARKHDNLWVDLTQKNLTKINLEKIPHLDFSYVWVKLTSEQEQQLPEKFQQQRYARLFAAIDTNDLKELAICLQQGLNINFIDKNTGRTPFMAACMKSNLATVQFLLEKGGDPKIKTKENWLIIESTARLEGRRDIVKLLVQNGEKLDFISALYIANSAEELNDFQEEDIKQKINLNDHNGNLPLHIVIGKKNLALVKWLVEQGADLKAKSTRNKIPLEYAIEKGSFEIVEFLLNTNKIDITETMVLYAFEQQQTEIAVLLRKQLKTIDNFALAIYLDELHNNESVKKGLLQNINQLLLPNKKFTALALACRLGRLDVIDWLLNNGAAIDGVCQGNTPLAHAVEAGQIAAMKRLIEKGASPNESVKSSTPPFFIAVREGSLELIQLLLDTKKVDVQQMYLGRTALFVAVQNNRPEVVQLLLEAGWNPYATDMLGNTPLHIAATNGNEECVRILSEAVRQPKNHAGKIPRDLVSLEKQEQLSPLLGVKKEITFSPIPSKKKRSSYGAFFESGDDFIVSNDNNNISSNNSNNGSTGTSFGYDSVQNN